MSLVQVEGGQEKFLFSFPSFSVLLNFCLLTFSQMEYAKNVEAAFRLPFFSKCLIFFFFLGGKKSAGYFLGEVQRSLWCLADEDVVHHVIRSLHFLLLPIKTAKPSGQVGAKERGREVDIKLTFFFFFLHKANFPK